MKRDTLFILFLLGFISNSFAQKIIEREFDAANLATIEINSDDIFAIRITSGKTNKIKIKTNIEGENFENVVLSVVKKNETLIINPEYSPFFKAKNDKLAAHKVIAIELDVFIPENFEIHIKSALASVETNGSFKLISALLEKGNCNFNNFKGNAIVKTNNGAITIYANQKTTGTAISKKGIVINELSNNGVYSINAESIRGDISLLQIH